MPRNFVEDARIATLFYSEAVAEKQGSFQAKLNDGEVVDYTSVTITDCYDYDPKYESCFDKEHQIPMSQIVSAPFLTPTHS